MIFIIVAPMGWGLFLPASPVLSVALWSEEPTSDRQEGAGEEPFTVQSRKPHD